MTVELNVKRIPNQAFSDKWRPRDESIGKWGFVWEGSSLLTIHLKLKFLILIKSWWNCDGPDKFKLKENRDMWATGWWCEHSGKVRRGGNGKRRGGGRGKTPGREREVDHVSRSAEGQLQGEVPADAADQVQVQRQHETKDSGDQSWGWEEMKLALLQLSCQ